VFSTTEMYIPYLQGRKALICLLQLYIYEVLLLYVFLSFLYNNIIFVSV